MRPIHASPDVQAALIRDGFAVADGGRLWMDAPERPGLWRRLAKLIGKETEMTRLEHVNVTVADPDATAALLSDLFGWRTRWKGGSIHGGRSIHVGDDDTYVAVYSGPEGVSETASSSSYTTRGGMNHIGVVVDDLDAVEEKVKAHGYAPHSHADYEPGRRFYFHEENGIEIEVVSYA